MTERCASEKIAHAFIPLRSFKVIDFCTNQKPIYDLLLMIDCDLSSISHRLRNR